MIDKKIIKQVKTLNEGYDYIVYGLKQINQVMSKNEEVKIYIWRIEKMLSELQKIILKELKVEDVNNEFNKIIKKLK